ncbi:unnamed protein product [Polarella glacialis]|uniref:RNA-editing substrate-binding complex 6 protein domain-containing protein n=1 Tax=Polarella glacialis TaxID=89957 RepID=A0A813FP49_POLGL|nr:unnamed protein product [Polarella glacialis]
MMASSFASLGVPHAAMFEAIAAAAVRGISRFNARDLESVVFAFATAGVAAPELFAAVAAQALPKLRDFNSLDLANLSWAFVKAGKGLASDSLLQAVAPRAVVLLDQGSFPSQALANLAWAFKFAQVESQQVLQRLSKEVVRKMDRHEVHHVVALLALDLPCAEALGQHLGKVLFHFLCAMPQKREGWWNDDFENVVVGLKADHLGRLGTRFVLAKLGASSSPPLGFLRRARKEIERHFERHPALLKELIRSGSATEGRAAAFLEYEICETRHGRLPKLQGCLLRENAAPIGRKDEPRCLRPVRSLKVGSHIDRGLRGEFLVLEELCCKLLALEASHLEGTVRLYATGFPCLSCLSAVAQFRQGWGCGRLDRVQASTCTQLHDASLRFGGAIAS